MTKLLIHPSEVISLAFEPNIEGVLEHITTAQILASQARYILPIFGDIYPALLKGLHSEFVKYYIKPALAMFIKASILPYRGFVQGPLGISYATIHEDLEIEQDRITQLQELIIKDANALISSAVHYLKQNPQEFGDYNDFERISGVLFSGGLIL